MEEYIRGFHGLYRQTLSYGLRDDWISPVSASDPMYHANGSKYFTQNEEMIAQGSILSGPAVIGNETEEIVPFTEYLINDR